MQFVYLCILDIFPSATHHKNNHCTIHIDINTIYIQLTHRMFCYTILSFAFRENFAQGSLSKLRF